MYAIYTTDYFDDDGNRMDDPPKTLIGFVSNKVEADRVTDMVECIVRSWRYDQSPTTFDEDHRSEVIDYLSSVGAPVENEVVMENVDLILRRWRTARDSPRRPTFDKDCGSEVIDYLSSIGAPKCVLARLRTYAGPSLSIHAVHVSALKP